MREILFRGKRKDGNGWAYGDLNQHSHGTTILENGVINHAVIPETVGQYTGLKDKDEKRIFEGDILGDTYDFLFVEYCEKCGQFTLQWTFDKNICVQCDGDIFWYDWAFDEKLKVVGNIHDNPKIQP